MKYLSFLFFFFLPLISHPESLQTNTAPINEENRLFQKIIQKYKNSSGVTMNFKKNTHLKFLKKNRYSTGKIFLSQGLMKLDIEDSMNTRLIFDKNNLWYQTSTPEGKIKTAKIDLKKEIQNKAIISLLFNPDLFFQVFRFVSSRSKGRTTILEFLPIQKQQNISRLSIKIESDRILQLELEWEDLGTVEEYTFSDIRMNQKIPEKTFKVDMASG